MQSVEPLRGPAGQAGPTPRRQDHDARAVRPRVAWLWAAAAGILLARVPALPGRVFDPDEFEHAHAAWCLSRGLVLYKDFFEHHTPWYYYALRPLFNWFAVGQSLQAGTAFLLAGRLVSFALTAVTLLLVARVAVRAGATTTGGQHDSRVLGPLAALLLVSQPIFLQKTIELRPDVLALPFFVGALLLLVRGLANRPDPTARRLAIFLAAGLCQGGAIMCTQKMLFILPGLAAGVGVWALAGGDDARGIRGLGGRLLCGVLFSIGLVLPFVATWAAFSAQGAGSQFITENFLLNARWQHLPTKHFTRLLLNSGPLFVLTLVGTAVLLTRGLRSRPRDHAGILLLTTMLGVLLGALVVPVAQRQYYLMMMPPAAVLAARGLAILRTLLSRHPTLGQSLRRTLAVAATAGLSIAPIIALVNTYRERNDDQVALLAQVYARTAPTDLVMDGWRGMGVFRPHAYHHYFLHEEAVAMLSPDDLNAYLDALESGTIQPRLIVMDKNLSSLGPRFLHFVTTHYTTTDNILYFRN